MPSSEIFSTKQKYTCCHESAIVSKDKDGGALISDACMQRKQHIVGDQTHA